MRFKEHHVIIPEMLFTHHPMHVCEALQTAKHFHQAAHLLLPLALYMLGMFHYTHFFFKIMKPKSNKLSDFPKVSS